MKQGGYDLGHYVVYFIVAAVIIAAPLLTIRSYASRGYYEELQDQRQVQEYLFSRYLVDCLASRDEQQHILLGTVTLSQFTDQRLSSCTSEPVVVTLERPGEVGVLLIATDSSLKQYTSLRTLRRETVLVAGQRSLLTVGVKDA